MEALSSVYQFVLGTSALSQLVQVVLLAIIVFVVLQMGNSLLNAIEVYNQSTTPLLPKLYDGPQVIYQDPNQKGAITIYPSTNAPGGLEFSYSCFLLLNKQTFQGNSDGLRHIFHKGSTNYKPLLCPGVFVKNNENTLVIYMNTVGSWQTYCEIPISRLASSFTWSSMSRIRMWMCTSMGMWHIV
jgi:hypothetical protein